MAKFYSSKSNAARAAKKLNNGTLKGLELLTTKEGFCYVPAKAAKPAAAKKVAPAPTLGAVPAKAAPLAPLPAKAAKPVPLAHTERAARATRTGPRYHIQRDRATANGITRPSSGTKCGNVWDLMDSLAKGDPSSLTLAIAKEQGAAAGLNANNVVIEFYRWRRFNGIRGRQ